MNAADKSQLLYWDSNCSLTAYLQHSVYLVYCFGRILQMLQDLAFYYQVKAPIREG